jgi:AAA15 family ATPase/GTPase
MIIEFSVENFASFKDRQTLSFEAAKGEHLADYYLVKKGKMLLLKLVLLYGANASGKTNLLKALAMLRQLAVWPAEKKTTPLSFEPFLFDQATPQGPSRLAISFWQGDKQYDYQVAFTRQAILTERLDQHYPNAKGTYIQAKVYSRTTDLAQQLTSIEFGSTVGLEQAARKALEVNTLWNNTVLGGFLKTNIEQAELSEATQWFNNHLGRLIYPGFDLNEFITSQVVQGKIHKSALIQVLRKADLNISDFFIKEPRQDKTLTLFASPSSLEFEHLIDGQTYRLPFEQESSGTQRYYGFAGLLALLIQNPSTNFQIDELESSLHPDLFTHFILSFLANAKEAQLLATTHHREILGNPDIFRDDAIWFAQKNAAGATQIYSLADFDDRVIKRTNDIYQAYKAGKWGGLPDLGDYYIDLNDEK